MGAITIIHNFIKNARMTMFKNPLIKDSTFDFSSVYLYYVTG